ncbi:hypothetical protein KSD_37770 [Ktedonobacter sp. SOSP1-85]|uniref:D-alanyl-D-alanine carboxypeptidase family protein n=1 Tax=Ktedonobacter sp. SOSP1-85 TaxID=2778367 RepID=UPI001916B80A|nr:serine hydrolase [Ktedonobacter sp. SOSP1-85]GHO76006.1 hypothetical protein KSD_37770 [Ktedonobacter sp. SOSP1-85]
MPDIPSQDDEQSRYYPPAPTDDDDDSLYEDQDTATTPRRRPRRHYVYHTGEYTDQPSVRRASRPQTLEQERASYAQHNATYAEDFDDVEYDDAHGEFFADEEEETIDLPFEEEEPLEPEEEVAAPQRQVNKKPDRASQGKQIRTRYPRRSLEDDEEELVDPDTKTRATSKTPGEARDLVVVSGTTRFLPEEEEEEDPEDRPSRLPRTPRTAHQRAVATPRTQVRKYTSVYEPTASAPTRAPRYRRPLREAPEPRLPLPAFFKDRNVLLFIAVALLILVLLPLGFNYIRGNNSSAITLPNPLNIGNAVTPTVDPNQVVVEAPTTDHPSPPVYANAAYVLDADTGKTLYAQNPLMHLPMLSTTKLMTAYLAAHMGKPDQRITITDAIDRDLQNDLSADSSLMGVKKGETYTLKELLYGLMLVSGNDAAIVIADALSGNVPAFVAKMNQQLGTWNLHNTHYMNPHGLIVPNHYSSAHDLAYIGKYSLGDPLIHEVSATQHYLIPGNGDHAAHDMYNGNQFLWWYPGVDGGKPGWDGEKNFNQVISCVRNQHHLIGVTLHTSDWWTDMRDLMNWGFNTYDWISPAIEDLKHPIPYDTDWNYFTKDKKENTIPMANGGRYYVFTGYSTSGPIQQFFDKNGGLNKIGFPISSPKTNENATISQKFEHATIACDTSGAKQCRKI